MIQNYGQYIVFLGQADFSKEMGSELLNDQLINITYPQINSYPQTALYMHGFVMAEITEIFQP